MTENAVKGQDTPPPADHSDADRAAQQLIKNLQYVLRELTGWRVWASNAGTLYATRTSDLTRGEISAGMEMTLVADDARTLLEKIKRQVDVTARYAAMKDAQRPSGF